jgi:arabinose-5-phosphate isomerase
MNKTVVLQRAKEVLNIEATGIVSLIDRLDDHFIQAIELLYNCRGKVVVTGLGKSGLVCRKIAATFSSMGTPSFFLHAGDANHGDMGMIMEGDVVLAVSNSGETEEILTLIPTLKRIGVRIIAMTGNHDSPSRRRTSFSTRVTEGAPSAATDGTATAALAFGAPAVILLRKRVSKKKILRCAIRGILDANCLRVEDLMHWDGDVPLVGEELHEGGHSSHNLKGLGVTGVTDKRGDLWVITDGDLRRGLQAHGDGILSKRAEQIMTLKPRSIEKDALASQALARMEENRPRPITSLFVVEKPGDTVPVGILHIHDLLKAGIV